MGCASQQPAAGQVRQPGLGGVEADVQPYLGAQEHVASQLEQRPGKQGRRSRLSRRRSAGDRERPPGQVASAVCHNRVTRRGGRYRATASGSATRWTLTWRSGWTGTGGTRSTDLRRLPVDDPPVLPGFEFATCRGYGRRRRPPGCAASCRAWRTASTRSSCVSGVGYSMGERAGPPLPDWGEGPRRPGSRPG